MSFNRVPPNATDAEVSILGGLMLDPETWEEVSDQITADDFYNNANKKIFHCMSALNQKNLPIDLITVSNHLQETQSLQSIGGPDYLIEVLNKTISAANISSYAKLVEEKSILRKLIKTSTDIIQNAYNQDYEDIIGFVDQAESQIFNVIGRRKLDGLTCAIDIVKNSMKKFEELSKLDSDVIGLPSGFKELDKMTAGLHPGELVILAARPSMGKTAFGLNIALHAALQEKKTIAFFSLEMGKEQLMLRLLSQRSRVNMSSLKVGRVGPKDWSRVIDSASQISESQLFIDDTSGISPFEIRTKCRRHKKQYGLDLIIIDYLQLMDLKQRVESRERAVSEISRKLKELAKELHVPVIALAQLNRGVEGRSDRRPILSDLRESGSIEQDADMIMMLFREDYYDRDDPDKIGNAEVILNKHRNGPTGAVKLKFEAKYGIFRDPDPLHHEGPMPPSPPSPFKHDHKASVTNINQLKNFAPGN